MSWALTSSSSSTYERTSLKGYVEKADDDVIHVNVLDPALCADIAALGFCADATDGMFSLGVSRDEHKARVFDALRALEMAFCDGKERCPVGVFEYLRDKRLLTGKFVRVSWEKPGDYQLVLV